MGDNAAHRAHGLAPYAREGHRMRTLDRYILLEILRGLGLALSAVTVLFLFAGLAAEAVKRGLSPTQIVEIAPYVVPGTLPYTLPATLLFAVILTYGRMSADREVVALKAAGIHAFRLLAPALWLAAAATVLTWWALNYWIPPARQKIRLVVLRHLEEVVYSVLKRERAIASSRLPCQIYVRGVDGKTLLGATFQRQDEETGQQVIAYAERATLEFDLEKGRVLLRMRNAEVQVGSSSVKVAQEHVFPIPLPAEALELSDSPREMTRQTLQQEIARLRQELPSLCQAAVAYEAELRRAPRQARAVSRVGSMDPVARWKGAVRRLRRLEAEAHLRSALAAGSLVFVLLGGPVAIVQQRGDFLSAFVSCFLPIVTLYYPLLLLGMNLGKEGVAPPALTMWAANGLLAAGSLPLLRQVIRY
jgi:lipopolysaccharide export system permease protein